MSDDVTVLVDEAVAQVAFNRPDIGNAVTPDQAEQLRDILHQLDADPAVRVVVLTGSGATFNVGAARTPTAAQSTDPVASYRAQIPVMLEVIDLLYRSSMISISAINGGCAGAGFAIALASDLRYSSSSARFNSAFLSVGLSGELGAIWFAVRLIGLARARELFLLPEKISATRLAELGLLNGVIAPDELLPSVLATAEQLAGYPPVAMAAMKANFVHAATHSLDHYLPLELDGMTRSIAARVRPERIDP